MRKNTIFKMLLLNIIIILINIILFSNAFLHIKIFGENAFQTALGITAIVMSVIVFFYGNHKYLTQKENIVRIQDIKTLDDCIESIYQNRDKKTFEENLDKVLNQIKRFNKKEETIHDILLQKFVPEEMSYLSFKKAVDNVENVIYLNIRSLINRINAFDEHEYKQIKIENMQYGKKSESALEKMQIYNEYIKFVEDAVEDNEQIIIKLDKLLLEITKLNSIETGEIENMDAMKEIDDLINNTKWYK